MSAKAEAWDKLDRLGCLTCLACQCPEKPLTHCHKEKRDAVEAYAAACVAEALASAKLAVDAACKATWDNATAAVLADHPDCGKYCVCCQRGVDLGSDDLLDAHKREVAALEALTDPLRLLEALAEEDTTLSLRIRVGDGRVSCLKENKYGWVPLTREETLVLLAGEGDEHDER